MRLKQRQLQLLLRQSRRQNRLLQPRPQRTRKWLHRKLLKRLKQRLPLKLLLNKKLLKKKQPLPPQRQSKLRPPQLLKLRQTPPKRQPHQRSQRPPSPLSLPPLSPPPPSPLSPQRPPSQQRHPPPTSNPRTRRNDERINLIHHH